MRLLDRQYLRDIASSATLTPEQREKLAVAAQKPLVDLVLDASEPWWRRRACVEALSGRVPPDLADSLVDAICDAQTTSDVRAALIDALAFAGDHTPRLLAWLRAEDPAKQPYGLDLAILRARSTLGDVSALPALCELAADPWRHRRTVGERALAWMVAALGSGRVLEALGATAWSGLAFDDLRVGVRRFAVTMLHREGGDIARALGDASTSIAQHAHTLLTDTAGCDDGLWAIARAAGPGHLWALVVLAARGHDISEAWVALGRPRVELPFVPSDVRAAVLREYLPGERHTDPRWLLEAICDEPPASPDDEVLLARAVEALAAFSPQPPVSAGEQHRQGGGSYYVITTSVDVVTVSTLGAFFSCDDQLSPACTAMQAAGFRFIDGHLARIVFDGLAVYFFGRRGPLTVSDLLFYWQD